MKSPTKFGDYYLFDRIAVGGMAEVFRAASYGVEAFERLLAVKRVLPNIAEDQEFIDMFIDEAKIAVQLSHTNIGRVYELGNADGAYYIAMEYVSGKDARAIFDRARSRNDRLDVSMCCHIVKEVCEALEYAHNKANAQGEPLNIVHRDVSPQNILIGYDGEVKLIDFGIAKAAGKANNTQAGILKGKFGYMSPEQVRGRPIDRRSDVFSLATVLYELLTLERCFQGVDDFSTLEKVRKVDFKRPTLLNRSISPELERIIYRGLTRNPKDRFQSAAELQDALQKFLYKTESFYSRKDLAEYMRDTFSRDLEEQKQRLAAYRAYAQSNIVEARKPEDIPTADLTMESFLGSTDPDDSTLDDPKDGRVVGDYPSSAKTIRRDPKPTPSDRRPSNPTPSPQRETKRRLWWLVAISIFASVAAFLAVQSCSERMGSFNPGSINLSTQPSEVQVYLNGQKLGVERTPVELGNLAPGEHWLIVEAPRYKRERRQLELAAGETVKVDIKLQSEIPKTTLIVETSPAGAQVFLDGKEIDETPMRLSEVKPGQHSLRLEKSGYLPWAGRITLLEGTENQVPLIRLSPKIVTVTLVPEPTNATLTIIDPNHGQRVLGQGAQVIENMVNSGKVRIKATAPGYVTLERPLPGILDLRHTEFVNLERRPNSAPKRRQSAQQAGGQTRDSSARSRAQKDPPKKQPIVSIGTGESKAKGSLKLIAVPPARAYVNGKDLGWTPVLEHRLPPGRHAVLLVREELPNYRESFTVDISPGTTTFKRFVKP